MNWLIAGLISGILLLGCGQEGAVMATQTVESGVAGDGRLAIVLEAIRAEQDLPSLGAMLIVGDQIVEQEAVGLRAVSSEVPVTTEDLWHLGSLTKAMTATLAARMVEAGQITWSVTVRDIFPDLVGRIHDEYLDVSLQELLSHTGGLVTDVTRTPSWPTLRTDPSPLITQRRRWTVELLSLEPEAARGTYRYSNAGYVVAGTMLEEVAGEAWESLMHRELFEPLGMLATGFGPPGESATVDQPRAHVRVGRDWRAVEPGPAADNPAAIGPAGTVHAPFADYAQYIMAHLAGARDEPSSLLSVATFKKLHTPMPGMTYALGWGVGERSWADGRVLQHSGSNTMWWATIWIAPERNLAMLAVTNAGGDRANEGTDKAILALIERFEAAF